MEARKRHIPNILCKPSPVVVPFSPFSSVAVTEDTFIPQKMEEETSDPLAIPEPKRKHKTLSLSEKCEILKSLDRGAKYTELAKRYNVGRATIYDIKKNRERIEHFLRSAPGSIERQTMKKGYNPEVDEAVYEWFIQERTRHAPINGELLRAKARLIYKEKTGREDFRASDGWLDKFKRRYAIRLCPSFIRNLPVTNSDVENFLEEFSDKMKTQDLHPEQIFGAGECELLWRHLPSKNAEESKKSSDRLTLILCSNATGKYKTKLLVVGKSESPKSLNDSENSLPVFYRSDRRSRVTSEIFVDWYEELVPALRSYLVEQNLPERALVILDNSMAQGLSKEDLRVQTVDGPIEVMFLPPNATALLHPMDDVSKKFISIYKTRLLTDMATDSDDAAVNTFLHRYDTKAAILNVASTWQSVSKSTITQAWKKVWPASWLLEDSGECEQDNFEQVVSMFFSKKAFTETFSVTDVYKWLSGVDKDVTNEETVQEPEQRLKVAPQDALLAFNTCLAWAEDNNVDAEEIQVLKRLHEKAFEAAINAQDVPVYVNINESDKDEGVSVEAEVSVKEEVGEVNTDVLKEEVVIKEEMICDDDN